jgi:DNA polymerase (family 10)
LETVVRAARDKGYAYCAITDHSKSLTMAFGFDTARVRQSVEEIAAVRKAVPDIEVLHGLEVDILADGSLDLDEEGLAMLDWVIVSLHSRLKQPREEMTARVLKALSHPAVHVMGHPTARRIGEREPVELNVEAALDQAARHGVMMEINAQPHRTDLNDVNARLAKERGIKMVINTDSHRLRDLDYMQYGVFAARRAGLTRADVLNTLPYEDFQAVLAERRARSART